VSYLLFHVPFLAAKPVPFNPNRVKWGEMGAALVGVAGPLTNLALAVIASFMIRAGLDGNVLAIFMQINIVLFVFNMIPFPPLDGSRLLYALAPEPIQEVMARIESAGIMAIMIFMLIFFSFLSPIILNIDNWIFNFLLR
jgi:Zn-dependent protease